MKYCRNVQIQDNKASDFEPVLAITATPNCELIQMNGNTGLQGK